MGLHIFQEYFEKLHFEKMTCVIFVGDQNLISGRSPPSSENKKDAQRSYDQFPGSSASRWLF